MLPLNSQKAMFSAEETAVIRFALNIFLQTDFSGLTSKQEETKAKNSAKEIIDKITANINDFKFRELCVMAGAVDYCEPHTCDFNHELGEQNSQRI